MISTFPSIFPSSDSHLFPSFDGGFTPWSWDTQEIFPAVVQSPKSGSTPVTSNSGSTDPVQSGSVSDGPAVGLLEPKPGPDEPNRSPVSVIDERKRRRMVSNRESARRSRMRKQKHVENLRNQVNRIRVENRGLANRLRFTSYHLQMVRSDNSRLRSELVMLRQKLNNIRQFLLCQRQEFPIAIPMQY